MGQEPTRPGGPQEPRDLRLRAFVLALVLLVPVSYLTANAQVSHMFSLLTAPVGTLILLVAANFALRRWFPRFALDQTDLVLVFTMCSIGSAVAAEWAWVGHSAMHMFPISAQTNPVSRDVVLPNLPDWLAVRDYELLKDLPNGGYDAAYVAKKLPMYLPLYLAWGTLVLSIVFAGFCINSLMRGAWCKTERLTFPLVQLPIAMAEKGGAGPMWASRYTWIAFAVMFGIDMLNGLNFLYPNVPRIPVKDLVMLQDLFKDPPWNQIGFFPIAIYPFMAAIGLFMPSSLTISLIAFFLLRKATHVFLAAQGYPQGTFSGTFLAPGPPFFDEQTWGGVLALFVGAMWASRGYLKGVWNDIRTGAKPEDGGISHRWAFVGLVACFSVVVVYGLLGTLSWMYMVPYVGLFLIFSVVLTRIRAQLGPPTHEFAFFGPNSLMHRLLGNSWLTNRQVVWVNQVFIVMNRIYRTHPMPHHLESLKMGQHENLNLKRLFWGGVVAAVSAFFLAYFFLHLYAYRTGQWGRWADGLSYVSTMIGDRKGPDLVGIAMTIFGFAVVGLLDAARFRFPGFPLHPAGYVLSMNFGVDYYWFGLLLALMAKAFVQRYYGLKGYDKLRNVAFGILIGEYLAETIWMSIALATQQSTYTISFNERGLGVQ